jgi:hypothetical protein
MQQAPKEIEVWEAGDVVKNDPEAVVWYHRNENSCVPLTLKHQSLDQFAALVKDPILHRTFGGSITAEGFVKDGLLALKSSAPVTRFAVRIATHSAVAETHATWEKQLADRAAASADTAAVARRTADWWNAFWDRSWVFVNGDVAEGGGGFEPTPSLVTRAFVLQRWMNACAGRGNYPIKFNGSIFTVDPEFTDPKQIYNADWRRWGDCYWWQNTRFPAFSALANGDYDLCTSLFRMYRDVLPICQARARFYYGAGGAYFPEIMTFFGTYANRDYGWDRQGKQPGDIACRYWCYAWQQGLELVMLMLDYHDHTGDTRFFAEQLLPMAHEVLRYFDSRFARDSSGKLVISPTQSVETYWFDVVNDTPSVAGLVAVLDRLLALPQKDVPALERVYWKKLREAAPSVPMRTEDGKSFIAPAEKFNPKRSNCENPELYPVWPFRLFGVGRPGLDAGIETFNRRGAKIMTGWCYDGQCAAILGLTDESRKQLLTKVRNSHRNHRFPAMWGPNFDWLPDQDHGNNILLTLQHMLLACDRDKIHLLPAWPKQWNVRFKLHAPRRTVVEAEWRDNKLTQLKVTPEERRQDVEVMGVK